MPTSLAGNGRTGPREYARPIQHGCANTAYRFIAFLQCTATPLIDLSLYVSAENYNTTTSSAYTAILPWYANYTVPPKRRELARTRTAHLGLSSLDVDTSAKEDFTPGRGTASSEFEAAKRAAGIPTEGHPNALSMGRGTGIGGLFGRQVYAARFTLDPLSNELLEPLSDLLGKNNYLLRGDHPSSLDCLAFGYLSLLYFPNMPQAWIKEAIETKHPRIVSYLRRLRQDFFKSEEIEPADIWLLSTGTTATNGRYQLPWQSKHWTFYLSTLAGAREFVGNLPLVSSFTQKNVVPLDSRELSRQTRSDLPSPLSINMMLGVTSVFVVGLASLAIHHRRSSRDGELIFWALRPREGFGEAANILSVLANQGSGALYSQF